MPKNFFGILFLVGVLVATFLIFKGCGNIGPEQPLTPNISDSLKGVIRLQEKERDSLLIVAGRKDSVRVEYITKWKKLKGDTAYLPCDTILNIVISTCDSIIAIDSSLIADLKTVIKKDSVIISGCKKVMNEDSITIVGLNSEIRKHKRHKKWLLGGLIGVSAIAIIK